MKGNKIGKKINVTLTIITRTHMQRVFNLFHKRNSLQRLKIWKKTLTFFLPGKNTIVVVQGAPTFAGFAYFLINPVNADETPWGEGEGVKVHKVLWNDGGVGIG